MFPLFQQNNLSSEKESGPEYLKEFSKFLKEEFKNKSVQDIFSLAKAVIKVTTFIRFSVKIYLPVFPEIEGKHRQYFDIFVCVK